MRIRNVTQGTEVASEARTARSHWSRLVGLLGRGSLRPGEALLIEPCSSVHTAFMRFTIDVIYLDRAQRVVKVVPRLKPFRASGARNGAHAVLELPSGTIERTGTSVGDELAFES
ncbi:MAG: DUF192 domain-containing protein [Chloroflexi bacterium]|nr:DUF192 domain-containing protein [Chloroflexota bacterium]